MDLVIVTIVLMGLLVIAVLVALLVAIHNLLQALLVEVRDISQQMDRMRRIQQATQQIALDLHEPGPQGLE